MIHEDLPFSIKRGTKEGKDQFDEIRKQVYFFGPRSGEIPMKAGAPGLAVFARPGSG
jgi:hypothetical protein